MKEKFNTEPQNIKVEIGPSAKKCCYEVGRDSSEHLDYVSENFGTEFVHEKNIDLNGISLLLLEREGVLKENITISNNCTVCKYDKYFSYRKTGEKNNFAGVISIINE